LKAVIFDMDGVLVDSEPVYMNYFYEPFVRHNQDVSLQDIYSVIGTTMEDTWRILGEAWQPLKSLEEIQELYTHDVDEAFVDYDDLKMPHIKHLMHQLQKNNIKMGVASASPKETIKRVLKECQLESYISFYVSGEEVKASKPAPDVYLEVMRALEVKPENTIVIEDSTLGIKAGKSAGATVIAMKDNRFGMDQSEADHFVNDHMESYHLIKRLFDL